MAEIHPFRGVRYNPQIITDLSTVICPPYDIISPQMQQELYQRNEYNFVRVEFSRELPQDTANDNKYSRAAASLQQWLERGIFKIDDSPAIYIHDHYFTYQSKEYRRRSMVASVHLEEWDKRVIRPHEGTLSNPKTDRISLLWACSANTSPILALYGDLEGRLSSLMAAQAKKKPVISTGSRNGERHQVWAVDHSSKLEQIQRILADEPLYIADGHHRYESALTYQRERRVCSPSSPGEEPPYDFVMMTLVDFADPGLIILPPHRLVRGVTRATLGGLLAKIKTFFDIEELSLGEPSIWQKVDHLLGIEARQDQLVLFGLVPEKLLVLTLRDRNATNQMMPYFHTDIYKGLMVSVVDHVILERLLELSNDRTESILAYSYDRADAVKKVTDGEYQLALLLSPVKPQVVKDIADAGDRMPRKSTYFYPKEPAGLVFRLM